MKIEINNNKKFNAIKIMKNKKLHMLWIHKSLWPFYPIPIMGWLMWKNNAFTNVPFLREFWTTRGHCQAEKETWKREGEEMPVQIWRLLPWPWTGIMQAVELDAAILFWFKLIFQNLKIYSNSDNILCAYFQLQYRCSRLLWHYVTNFNILVS